MTSVAARIVNDVSNVTRMNRECYFVVQNNTLYYRVVLD